MLVGLEPPQELGVAEPEHIAAPRYVEQTLHVPELTLEYPARTSTIPDHLYMGSGTRRRRS